MFVDMFRRAINSGGLDRRDIGYIIRSEPVLTDEQIFEISNFINVFRATNVFFTRSVGDITIAPRIFNIAVTYELKNKDGVLLASIDIDFIKKTLYVKYIDNTVEIYNDFMDYEKNKNSQLMDTRMKFLNEIMTRYYISVVYSVYLELRRMRIRY